MKFIRYLFSGLLIATAALAVIILGVVLIYSSLLRCDLKLGFSRIQMSRKLLDVSYVLKTVRENLDMVKKQVRSENTVERALEYIGLSDVIDKKMYKLSGGEQQRVALARLMIKKCSVILADEPTGSLDPNNADKVIELKYKPMGFRTIEI